MKSKLLNKILFVIITLIFMFFPILSIARPGGGHGFRGGGHFSGGGHSGSGSFFNHSVDINGIFDLILYIIELLIKTVIEYPIASVTVVFVFLWFKFKD